MMEAIDTVIEDTIATEDGLVVELIEAENDITEITLADICALAAALPPSSEPAFAGALDRVLTMAAALDAFQRDVVLDQIVKQTGVKRRALNAVVKTALGTAKTSAAVASGVKPLSRGDHVEVSQRLVEIELKGAQFGDGKIHLYDAAKGVWQALSPEAVHHVVRRYAGVPVGPTGQPLRMDYSDLRGIRLATEEELDHTTGEFFRADVPAGFAFRNGFVSIGADGTISLRPHSAEHKARWAYDFDYDPSLPCPTFLAFLREITRDDPASERKGKVQLVLEHAGASLIGQAWRGGLALILHGGGNDGKSTLVSVLRDCFPPNTVAAVPPHDFGQDYKRAMLAGCLLNVCGELADRELKDAESIKDVITGRDLLQARNPYERPFFFRAVAGQLIVANTLPAVGDQSGGFWRRWAVVPFTRSFLAREENRNMGEQLAAEREAIVATLIQAAAAWIARGHKYELPKSVEVATAAWRSGADAVSLWVSTACDLVADGGMTGETAFRVFNEWRAANLFAPLSSRTFGERCKAILRGVAKAEQLHTGTSDTRYITIERDGCYRQDGHVMYPLRSKLEPAPAEENLDEFLN